MSRRLLRLFVDGRHLVDVVLNDEALEAYLPVAIGGVSGLKIVVTANEALSTSPSLSALTALE